MKPNALVALVFTISACGDDDDSPTSSATGGLSTSSLGYDWTNAATDDSWSFDTDGRFWFFPGDFDTRSFMGTWTLDGERIALNVDERGTLMLQVSLAGQALTVTRLCDESLEFYDDEQLASCRANPTAIYNRVGLF